MMYTINYGTGAGDFEIEGTLEDAERAADEGAAYTQTDIKIFDEDDELVAERFWYDVEYGEEYETENENADDGIIEFGTFGFYDYWQEF